MSNGTAFKDRFAPPLAVVSAAYIGLLAVGIFSQPGGLQVGDLIFPAAFVAAFPSLRTWRWHLLDVALLAFVACSALSLAGTLDPRASALGVAKEMYLLGVYAVTAGLTDAFGIRRVARWFAAGVAVTAAL